MLEIREGNRHEEIDKQTNSLVMVLKREVTTRRSHILHVDEIERFYQLSPEMAEKIVNDGLLNSQHKRNTETYNLVTQRQALVGKIKITLIGQLLAFSFAILGLISGLVCVYFGYPTLAGGLFTVTITGVVGSYLLERYKKESNPPEKS
ncbi:MAG: hypothetical protein QM537_02495 [Candidatus Symbiobacter sp.]|nr:hypothetical protein [Candidatus Symbiobacter sp.]